MKTLLLITLLAVTGSAFAGSDWREEGQKPFILMGEVADGCVELAQDQHGVETPTFFSVSDLSTEAALCLGVITGFMHWEFMARSGGWGEDERYCLNDSTTARDIAKVVAAEYFVNLEARKSARLTFMIGHAVTKAFPCPTEVTP